MRPAVFFVAWVALIGSCGRPPPQVTTRMEIAETIPVGGVEGLIVAAGSMWALGSSAGSNLDGPPVLRIDPASGKVIARISRGGPSNFAEATAGPDGLWVTSRTGSSGECDAADKEFEPGLRDVYVDGKPAKISSCDDFNEGFSRIDPTNNTFRDSASFADWMPDGIASTAEGLWITGGDDSGTFLTRRAPGSREFAKLERIEGVFSLKVGFGTLWGLGNDGLSRFLIATGRLVSSIPLNDVRSLAFGPDSAWATTKEGVVRIDPVTGGIIARISIDDPSGIAADADHVVVTGFRSHRLHRIDPQTNKVVETLDLGPPPEGSPLPVTTDVVLAGNSAWVANGDLVHVKLRREPRT